MPSSLPTPHDDTKWLAVVGAGRWGCNHVRTAESMGILGVVVDSSEDALSKVSGTCDAERTTSLEQALQMPNITGFVIATPPSSHYSLARRVLEAGKDVLVEKPLCDSLEKAKNLVEYAKSLVSPRVLMVGHILHYNSHHESLLDVVRSGTVGTVQRVKATRFKHGTVRTEENVLWSFCPHDVSIALALCGGVLPTMVRCTGQSTLAENPGVEDHVELEMRFGHGPCVRIEASWMHPEVERRTVVYCTDGCIVLNEVVQNPELPPLQVFRWGHKRSGPSDIVIWKHEVGNECASIAPVLLSKRGDPQVPMLRRELEHFAECCKSKPKRTPVTDGGEGLRVLTVLKAAEESMQHHDGAFVRTGGTDAAAVQPMDTAANAVVEPSRAFSAVRGVEQAQAYYRHPTAVVDSGCEIGDGAKIWHFCHVMSGARIGQGCSLGQNVYVGGRVVMGRNVKVQNNVSLYDGVTCEDDVFLGPSCVFTNIRTPRAFVSRRQEFVATVVKKGASIGANATVVCGVVIGAYSLVGAGATVTRDVAPHALVVGVPARRVSWVGRRGVPLEASADCARTLVCPESGETYALSEDEQAIRFVSNGAKRAADAP